MNGKFLLDTNIVIAFLTGDEHFAKIEQLNLVRW